MKSNTIKTFGAALSSVALLSASAASVAFANPVGASEATEANPVGIEESSSMAKSGLVEVSNVQGGFNFDQNTVTSNDQIRSMFRTATQALCSSLPDYEALSSDSLITIGGDVLNQFTATLGDMAHSKEAQNFIMACACAANIAGGGAIANAEVSGVTLESIAEMAGVK